MTAVDFSTLLSKKLDDVKRPPTLPAGTYNGAVVKHELLESSEKKTPFVRFHVQLLSPGADLTPEQMTGIDLSKKQLRRDYYLTPDAEYRLKEFIASCGINTAGQSFATTIPMVLNAQVIAEITTTPGKEDGEFYNNINSMKGAPR